MKWRTSAYNLRWWCLCISCKHSCCKEKQGFVFSR